MMRFDKLTPDRLADRFGVDDTYGGHYVYHGKHKYNSAVIWTQLGDDKECNNCPALNIRFGENRVVVVADKETELLYSNYNLKNKKGVERSL